MCIRDRLYDVIMEKAVSVGIGMASHERIDEINILQATYAVSYTHLDVYKRQCKGCS